MNKKNSTPLVEIIIFVGVFAVCAVILVNLFLVSNFNGVYANDVSIATLKAQSILDNTPKSILDEIKQIEKSGELSNNVTFDKAWNILSEGNGQSNNENEEYKAIVKYNITNSGDGYIVDITVNITKIKRYPFLNEDKMNLIEVKTSTFFL